MVVGDSVCNGLQEHGLTGFGLRHNKAALALADGRKHVHNPYALVFLMAVAKEIEFLCGEKGSEEVEGNPVADEFRCAAVYELDANKREVLVSLTGRTDFTGDGVSVLERILLYLLLGDIDVVRAVKIIVIRGTQEAVAVRHDFKDARSLYGTLKLNPLGFFRLLLRLFLRLLFRLLLRLFFGLFLLLFVLAGPSFLALTHLMRGIGFVVLQVFKEVLDELLSLFRLFRLRGLNGGRCFRGLRGNGGFGLASALFGSGFSVLCGLVFLNFFHRLGCLLGGGFGLRGLLLGTAAFFGGPGLRGFLGLYHGLGVQNGKAKGGKIHFGGTFNTKFFSKRSELCFTHSV